LWLFQNSLISTQYQVFIIDFTLYLLHCVSAFLSCLFLGSTEGGNQGLLMFTPSLEPHCWPFFTVIFWVWSHPFCLFLFVLSACLEQSSSQFPPPKKLRFKAWASSSLAVSTFTIQNLEGNFDIYFLWPNAQEYFFHLSSFNSHSDKKFYLPQEVLFNILTILTNISDLFSSLTVFSFHSTNLCICSLLFLLSFLCNSHFMVCHFNTFIEISRNNLGPLFPTIF
jgi:hypothetical protein